MILKSPAEGVEFFIKWVLPIYFLSVLLTHYSSKGWSRRAILVPNCFHLDNQFSNYELFPILFL